MKKIFYALCIICCLFPFLTFAQAGDSTNTETTGNTENIKSLETVLNTVEQKIFFLNQKHQRFLRDSTIQETREFNTELDIPSYKKDIEEIKEYIEKIKTEIDILEKRLGQSKKHVIPHINALRENNKDLKEKVTELEKNGNDFFDTYEKTKEDENIGFPYSWEGWEEEKFKTLKDSQEKFLNSLQQTSREIQETQKTFQTINHLLQSFRAPPVLKGGILPGPTVTDMQENPKTGLNYLAGQMLPAIANWLMVAIMSAGVLMIIVAGIFYIFTQEDETKTKAKDTLFWTIIGLVIAILSFTIVQIVIGLDINVL